MYKDWLALLHLGFSWCRKQHELDSISAHPFRSAVDTRTRRVCQVDIAAAPNFVQLSTRTRTPGGAIDNAPDRFKSYQYWAFLLDQTLQTLVSRCHSWLVTVSPT